MLNCNPNYFKKQPSPKKLYQAPEVWRASVTLKEKMIGRLYMRLEDEANADWGKIGDDTDSSNLENKTFDDSDW